MVWSKESAKAGTVGELSEGSHGWLDRQVHEETWIKLKNMQIYELNDDSSLHQLKNYAGTNAKAATSSAAEVRVGPASVEKNDSSI